MRKRFGLIVAIVVILAAIGGGAFAFRVRIQDSVAAVSKPNLPVAQSYTPPAQAPKPEAVKETSTPPVNVKPQVLGLAAEMNLAVPFTSQAPHANWSLPYQEACEEASLVMAQAYFNGETSISADEADKRILAMVDWEKTTFGFYEDTTAAEVGRIAKEYSGLRAEAKPIVSIDDAKREVAAGHVVLFPAAGRLLGNPYFSGAGPLYHMLVMKGYTKDGRIITNDPGTRRGADYLYDPATLFNAIHDWNGGDVVNGAKIMIVVQK